jgi:hypothetical protein
MVLVLVLVCNGIGCIGMQWYWQWCNTPRLNPIVNVNENVLKMVSCLI